MEAQEILNDKLKREYKVCVPAAVINGKVENFLLNTGKTTRIKGYSRPGKVPMVVLRQRFLAEALNHVLPQVLKEGHDYLLNLFRVTPAHQPKYKVNQFGEGKDLEYTVTFEVLPEVPQSPGKSCILSDISLLFPMNVLRKSWSKLPANAPPHVRILMICMSPKRETQ